MVRHGGHAHGGQLCRGLLEYGAVLRLQLRQFAARDEGWSVESWIFVTRVADSVYMCACAPAISHCPLGDSCPVGCCIYTAFSTLCLASSASSGNLVPTLAFLGSGPFIYPETRSASGFLERPADGWGPC